MGMNFDRAGFPSVDAMVNAMSSSEDEQLDAIGNFLKHTSLRSSLQTHDWASFARGYNGPNYAINRYDIKLNAEYHKYSAGALPDLSVRAAQLYLTYLGYHPGSIDGIAGQNTMSALVECKSATGIPDSTTIDDDCVKQLRDAVMKTLVSIG